MNDYEKLGAFYLGRLHDLAQRTDTKELLLYAQRWVPTRGQHTLPHALAVQIMERHEAGNAQVARELGRQDGVRNTEYTNRRVTLCG